jgi:hypothetical protein
MWKQEVHIRFLGQCLCKAVTWKTNDREVCYHHTAYDLQSPYTPPCVHCCATASPVVGTCIRMSG